jgi:general stress protein 26
MTTVKIPEAIKSFLEKSDFISLATTDRNGQPCAASKFMLKVENDTIFLVDFIKGKTWKNLQHNPLISLTVIDKHNLRDYQINGSAMILENGKEYDLLIKELCGKEIRFATTHVIKGVQRMKPYYDFIFPFSHQAVIIKVKACGIAEIGPVAELKSESELRVSGKKDPKTRGIPASLMIKIKYCLTRFLRRRCINKKHKRSRENDG